MKQNFLMPHVCKTAGWFIMVPLVIAWFAALGSERFGLFGGFGAWVGDAVFDRLTDPYIILLSASMLAVAFSRERDEDEYVASVRSKYLILAFYVDFVFMVAAAFAVHDLNYLYIMATQMFLILFLYIVMFNTAMAVIRKRRGYEE